MSEPMNPVVQRRQIATALREARVRDGLTIEQVAAELMCSPAKISRIETGRRPANPRDVRDLCRLYRLPEDVQARLIEMARQSRQPGWWEVHGLAPAHATFVGLEAIAATVRDYKSSVVPGLLQTAAYARAVIDAYFAPADPVVLERLVQARLQRQLGLFAEDADTPDIHLIMDEAALRRAVGGPDVMVEQLDRLIDGIDEFNIAVQVIPFTAGAHAGTETTFTIFTFADQSIPTAAFSEDIFGTMQLTTEDDLAKCERIFGLVTQAALPIDESLELVRSTRDQFAAAKVEADDVVGDETRDEDGAG